MTIAKEIIQKGEIQLTTEQRHEMQELKKKRIVDLIVRNAMDPKTKAPHPRTRIELAIEEAKVHIDPFKSVNQQMKTVIEALRPLIPISMEHARVSVKIPPEYVGKAYGAVRNFGTLEREEWQSDGSWIGIVKLPAGMQTDFYDRLNTLTKGNVETRVLMK
jgi:ribosome maturation protein SDO1